MHVSASGTGLTVVLLDSSTDDEMMATQARVSGWLA
jgi:hypothetical protein